MKPSDYFKGKKVVQMGLGLLGRGIGDAKLIAESGPKSFVITDKKSKEELSSSLKELEEYDINFVLGKHREEDFKEADLVLKAAGVPLDSPYIELARKNGAQILMSTALAAKYAQSLGMIVVGVTGTRGKSTTAQMIFGALKKYSGAKVFLGGNVRGVSTLELSKNFEPGAILVLELDSWQLQGFGDLKISPNIAIFTNFYPDHQNYYGSMEKYFEDKANIFRYQDLARGDLLVVSDEVYGKIKAENPPVEPFEASRIPEEWILKVPGAHNRANAALALEVLSQLGLSMSKIKEALESFSGISGRLQLLDDISNKFGFKIYNDNNATSPEATVAAIDALRNSEAKGRRLILIAGGSDKGLELEALARKINDYVDKLFLLDGTGTKKLTKLIEIDYILKDSFQALLEEVLNEAKKGDVVLFSPAFASFGKEFSNEYDREEKFLNFWESKVAS